MNPAPYSDLVSPPTFPLGEHTPVPWGRAIAQRTEIVSRPPLPNVPLRSYHKLGWLLGGLGGFLWACHRGEDTPDARVIER